MGILSLYLAQRVGKKREQRRFREEQTFDEETCDHCGYRREQHADDGSCPSYQ